jgi:hypothetical protein
MGKGWGIGIGDGEWGLGVGVIAFGGGGLGVGGWRILKIKNSFWSAPSPAPFSALSLSLTAAPQFLPNFD